MGSDVVPGVIEPGNLYSVAEARRRLHLGECAWRQLRRQGLPILRVGRNAYVLADDLISHFKNVGGSEVTGHA